ASSSSTSSAPIASNRYARHPTMSSRPSRNTDAPSARSTAARDASGGAESADQSVHDGAGLFSRFVVVVGSGDVEGHFAHRPEHGEGGRFDRLGRDVTGLDGVGEQLAHQPRVVLVADLG